MSNIVTFETKNYNSSAHVSHAYENIITVRVHKKRSSNLNTYFLPLSLLDAVQSLTSHTSLVAFAKDNQVNPDLQVETPCPCPPETAVFAANSASPVVGGDSLSPVVHDIYNIYSLDRVIVKQIDFFNLLVEHSINDELIAMFILDICHLSSITAYKYPVPLLKYASRNQKSLGNPPKLKTPNK